MAKYFGVQVDKMSEGWSVLAKTLVSWEGTSFLPVTIYIKSSLPIVCINISSPFLSSSNLLKGAP